MLLEKNRANLPTSTVGRGKTISASQDHSIPTYWSDDYVQAFCGDSVDLYQQWEAPTCIVSDGAYGVLGFPGDTADHTGLAAWYESHIREWSKYASRQTTLWFWNTEIGWASVHPVLERFGWKYINANVWNKGKGHIAGNVNTQKIRRFPVVSEMCVQYVFDPKMDGSSLQEWIYKEWKRTELPLRAANTACGVKDAAVRKYLDRGHLWYFPPPEMFQKMQEYANLHGKEDGRPYFSLDGGKTPGTAEQWEMMRAKFRCPHGFTNVWERPALRGKERYKVLGSSGKAVHLNQKPLDLMEMIIRASTDEGDVIWEPFGGLFSASVAARDAGRSAYGAEIDPCYFGYALTRLNQ